MERYTKHTADKAIDSQHTHAFDMWAYDANKVTNKPDYTLRNVTVSVIILVVVALIKFI